MPCGKITHGGIHDFQTTMALVDLDKEDIDAWPPPSLHPHPDDFKPRTLKTDDKVVEGPISVIDSEKGCWLSFQISLMPATHGMTEAEENEKSKNFIW